MSAWLGPVIITIATVAFMEFFAWWAHKYIMHGWGWAWHKSHHEPHDNSLEKNDLFVVVFAGVSVVMFWIGANFWSPMFWIAAGTAIYGILYFMAHDGLVHKRWPFRFVPRSGYLKRLYQAHRLHHAVKGKDGCVSFGFIWAPPVQDLKEKLQQNRDMLDLQMYENEEDALKSSA